MKKIILMMLGVFAIITIDHTYAGDMSYFKKLEARVEKYGSRIDGFQITDCPEEIETVNPSRTILQYIEHGIYKWNEYDLPGGKRCLELLKPERRRLKSEEAALLLSASLSWKDNLPLSEEKVLSPDDPSLQAIPRVKTFDDLKNDVKNFVPPDYIEDSLTHTLEKPFPSEFTLIDTSRDTKTRAVIGKDERVRLAGGNDQYFPYTSMTYLQFEFASGTYRGSGCLVTPYMVLTAAHNIYEDAASPWITSMIIAPYQYQETEGGQVYRPYGDRNALEVAISNAYEQAQDFEYDYGAAFIETPFSGISTFMPVIFDYTNSGQGFGISVTGYPAQVQQEDNSFGLWLSSSWIHSYGGLDDRLLLYTADTSGGQSGSPVYTQEPGYRAITAVHVSGSSQYNGASRMVASNRDLIEGWMAWTPEPEAPSLVYPSNGAVMDNGRTDKSEPLEWNFDWTSIQNTQFYHLQVTSAGGNGTNVIDNSGIVLSEFNYSIYDFFPTTLNPFTWKVRAYVNGSWGPWSETRNFNVESPDTDPPEKREALAVITPYGDVWGAENNGVSPFGNPFRRGWPGFFFDPDSGYMILTGDFTGDGLSDIFQITPYTSTWVAAYLGRNLSDPSGWGSFGFTYNEDTGYYLLPGDVNGDGMTDLIQFTPFGQVWSSLSTGTGFASPSVWGDLGFSFNRPVSGAGSLPMSGDFDNDGDDDLAQLTPYGDVWISLSNKSRFTEANRWAWLGFQYNPDENWHVLAADVSGDGKSDLVQFTPYGDVWVTLSSGAGFGAPSRWGWPGFLFDLDGGYYLMPADVNADGKKDIIQMTPTGDPWVSISTGSSFESPSRWGWLGFIHSRTQNFGAFYLGTN